MENERREKIALFRYGLIAPVLNETVKNQMEYFRELSQKEHAVPYGDKRKIRVATLKDWLKKYRKGGFEALKPRDRGDKGHSRKITQDLGELIKQSIASNPFLSSSAIYRVLIAQGSIEPHHFNEGTLRKFVRDHGLKENPLPIARKKFEKEHINELWIANCMHGPWIQHQGKKSKTFLIAAIDDRSRVLVGAKFFLENGLVK